MHVFSLRRSTLQPRLFQQACRLASISTRRIIAHAKREAALRPPPPARSEPRDEEDEAIRWFEKDVETGEVRRVAGNPEELEAEELRQKIAALEKELQEYRNEESDEDMLAALDPEDRAKVEKALKERKRREQHLTSGLDISLDMPPLTVPLLKRLNQAIRDAALAPAMVTRRKDAWRWYARARHSIPALPSMIPKKAWQLLWDSQSLESPTNPDRLSHMEHLLRDMASVDVSIMPDQPLVLVDTLLELSKVEQALNAWQEAHDATSSPSESLLALGVRIFSKQDRLEKAQAILIQLFDLFPDHDPRIILPILDADLRAAKDELAFGCYVLMRRRLGDDMQMDDYDAVSLTFLKYGKTDYALAVFRDMMLRRPNNQALENYADTSGQDDMYELVVKRMERLTDSVKNVNQVNAISLKTLSALPMQWQNKFFYGSWLKKLIGMQQLEAATKVIELMYERGIEPDARHMNGLISGYFRSGHARLQETGEQLAWKMVQRRLEARYRERAANRGEIVPHVSVYKTEEGIAIPAHISRPVPIATIETFNVLALHYNLNKKWSLIHHLDRLRRPALFKMDTTFFNHILHMIHGSYQEEEVLWKRFLTEAKHVSPDVETYGILWTAQLNHLDTRKTKIRSKTYPTPRQLFGLMHTWIQSNDPKKRQTLVEEFQPSIYASIISSFCLNKDFAGCLVALHCIARDFEVFPDPDIARIVMTGVANVQEVQPSTIRVRRGRQQLPANASRMKNSAKVMAALATKRAEAAAAQGVDITALDEKARKEESLNLLSEFIRLVLVRVHGEADVAENSISQAAQAMQVYDLSTGDKDCSNVG